MPDIDIVVALWNRATDKKQHTQNADRLRLLKSALKTCEPQFGTVLNRNQKVKSIFVAPEYYFAQHNAGQPERDGSLTERGVDEATKDFIVEQLLAISKEFPRVLLIPGTLAWTKSVVRSPGQQFKRDPQTYQRTNALKTQTRSQSLLNTYKQSYNTGGGHGGYLATELLRAKIRQELKVTHSHGLADAQDVDIEIGNLFNQSENDLKLDLQARFGTSAGMYKTVPNQMQNWALIANGTASHVMRNTAFVFLDGKIRFKYNKKADFHEALSDVGQTVFCPGAKSGFATIEGIDMGLEICLDHATQALQRTPLPMTGQPMLHILTSASVGVVYGHVRPNGYFIHASSDTFQAMVSQLAPTGWTELKPVQSYDVGGDPLNLYKIRLTVP